MGLMQDYTDLEADAPPSTPAPAPKKKAAGANKSVGRGKKPTKKKIQEPQPEPEPQPRPDNSTMMTTVFTQSTNPGAIFRLLDADKNGSLDMSELVHALADFGLHEEAAAEVLAALDTNKDGVVDEEEFKAGFTVFQDIANSKQAKIKSRALELEILDALVEARAQPELVAERIKGRLAWLKGTSMHRPGRPVPVETKEGKGAVEDALTFLAKQPPLPGFATEQVAGLALAAEDHVADIGSKGLVQHEGSDDSYFGDRQKRYGSFIGAAGECLWYGKTGPWLSGRDMIDDLIVDDGVATRGHRLCIYEAKYGCAGVSVGAHDIYSNMATIEFAAAYENDEEKVATRQAAGPPKIVGSGGGNKKKTQWKLGCCRGCHKEIKGGSVVQIPCKMHPKGNDKCKDCCKWHADCFVCTCCGTPLAGVAGKKMEKGSPYCNGCWTKEFGDVCAYCSKPIEGKVVKVGKTKKSLKCYHPECNEKRKESATGDKGGKGGKATFANAKQTLGGMGDVFSELG